jgi:hypothetical protein
MAVRLREYRSPRYLFFTKTSVGARFGFDGDDRLVSVRAFLSHGPEL